MKLSALIPTYNDDCTVLVKRLAFQAAQILDDEWEIIVGDDVSTDQAVVTHNKEINAWPHCRYIFKENNTGRAAIRNWLSQQAQGEWLLFVDADLAIIDDDYLQKMWDARGKCPVVCGGYQVLAGPKGNLRHRYEAKTAHSITAKQRATHPYNNFKISNTLIKAEVYAAHPLDERVQGYGYEDVLMGKDLQKSGVAVLHIDAPVGFSKFETNASFVAKTEEGLRTLCHLRNELQGYSNLLTAVERLHNMHLTHVVLGLYHLLGYHWRNGLVSPHPTLWHLHAYKLGFLLQLIADEATPTK